MDILYISPKVVSELTNYCENALLLEVIEHFAQKAKVIEKDNDTHPSRWWVITDYITDDTIEHRKKHRSFCRLPQ